MPLTQEQKPKPKHAAIRVAETGMHAVFATIRDHAFASSSIDAIETAALHDHVTEAARNFIVAIDQNVLDGVNKVAAIRCARLARYAAVECVAALKAGGVALDLLKLWLDIGIAETLNARWQACEPRCCQSHGAGITHDEYLARNRAKTPTPEQRAAHATRQRAREVRLRDDLDFKRKKAERHRRRKFGDPLVGGYHEGDCEMCGCTFAGMNSPRDFLVQDHNHTTGKLRGLICSGCNTGIGLLGDDVIGLERALAYLKKYEGR